MKKFIGAICSGVAGILTLVMLCLNWYTSEGLREGELKFTGWELLADKSGYLAKTYEIGYTLFKIFAIIAVVVAVLLILMAIIMLLKNLNVIKCKFNFSIINNILLTILVIVSIVLVIVLSIMGNGYVAEYEKFKLVAKASASVGAWLALAFSVVACGCGWALARKSK